VEPLSAPERPDPLEAFDGFTAAVRKRLEVGRDAYADASFSAEPAVLVRELQLEALDLAGWGFILFRRLESMQAALSTLAPSAPVAKSATMAPTAGPAPTIVGAKQEPQAEHAMVGGARLVPAERGTRPTPEQPAPESFAVAFTPDELVMLGALAVKLGMPPGEVLRFAVRRLWTEAGRQSKTSPPAPTGRLVGAERGAR
jgi:hypothetical protein